MSKQVLDVSPLAVTMYRFCQHMLPASIMSGVPAYVEGPPGIGKSTAIKDTLKWWAVHREAQNLMQRTVPDVHGVQFANYAKNTVQLGLPPYAERLLKNGGGVLVLEEYPSSTLQHQTVSHGIIDERVVGDTFIPNLSVVATGNPPETNAGAGDLLATVINRVMLVRIKADPLEWKNAQMSGWPTPTRPNLEADWKTVRQTLVTPLVVSFIEKKPHLLQAFPEDVAAQGRPWPSERSWENLQRIMAAGMAINAPDEDLYIMAAGCVGEGVASELWSYKKDMDLPDVEVWLKDVKKVKFPDRNDKVFMCLCAVASAFIANNTEPRYKAAWQIMHKAFEAGYKELAFHAVRHIVRNRKDDYAYPKKEAAPFVDLLVELGVLKK